MRSRSLVSESLENYLEAIALLGRYKVRSVDLASHMGVSKASINHAVNALISSGFVEKPPYGELSLTPLGLERAENILRKHQLIKRFLVEVLGVEEQIAETEACGIEHNLSDETFARFETYFKTMKKEFE